MKLSEKQTVDEEVEQDLLSAGTTIIQVEQELRTVGLFGDVEEEKMAEMQAKQSLKNGKSLKQVLTALKENRDQIEQSTGKRPDIDDTTKLFMQKVLNVWLSDGRDIDDEKFWDAVDYNKQFNYPVEYYER